MAEILLPVLYTLFVWWFSTGVILYLDGLPRSTFKWTLGAGTLLLVLAFAGLHETADDTRVTGAYLAFTAALVGLGLGRADLPAGHRHRPRAARPARRSPAAGSGCAMR